MPFAPGTSRTPSIVPSVARSHGRGRWHVFWSLLLVVAAMGCAGLRPSATSDATQLAAWDQWKQTRLNSIAGTNGWATLVGLLWIDEGRQSLGSAPSAKLRLPTGRAPLNAGNLIRSGTQVRFEAAPGVDATLDGTAVTSANLRSDANDAVPSVLQIGPLTLRILQRGERLAVRVKDPEAPTRVHFRGLDWPEKLEVSEPKLSRDWIYYKHEEYKSQLVQPKNSKAFAILARALFIPCGFFSLMQYLKLVRDR